MTKKQLEELKNNFVADICMTADYRHVETNTIRYIVNDFITFIEDQGVLKPNTDETLQDAHGECAKLKQ